MFRTFRTLANVLLLFSLCTRTTLLATESGKELHIYVSASLSGPDSHEGNSYKEGAELFAEEKNRLGGLFGRPLKVIAQDDSGLVEVAGKNAELALSDPDHFVTIGSPYSRVALPVSKIYARKKQLFFTAFATHKDIGKQGPTIFPLAYNDEFQGFVLARFAANTLKAKNVLVITNRSDPYSEGLSEEFIKIIGKKSAVRIKQFDFIKGDLRAEELFHLLNELKPDLVFVPLLREMAVEVIKLLSEIKHSDFNVLGSDGWPVQEQISSLIKETLSRAKNRKYYYTFFWIPEVNTPASNRIKVQYKTKTTGDPYIAGVLSMELLSTVFDAAVQAQSTKAEKIAQKLRSREWPGITGPVRFGKDGITRRPILLLELSGKGFRIHSIITPASWRPN